MQTSPGPPCKGKLPSCMVNRTAEYIHSLQAGRHQRERRKTSELQCQGLPPNFRSQTLSLGKGWRETQVLPKWVSFPLETSSPGMELTSNNNARSKIPCTQKGNFIVSRDVEGAGYFLAAQNPFPFLWEPTQTFLWRILFHYCMQS